MWQTPRTKKFYSFPRSNLILHGWHVITFFPFRPLPPVSQLVFKLNCDLQTLSYLLLLLLHHPPGSKSEMANKHIFQFQVFINHFTDCPFSTSRAFHWLWRSWNYLTASDDPIKRKGWLHLLISVGNWMNNKRKHDALDACRCRWRQKGKVFGKSSHFGSILNSDSMQSLRHCTMLLWEGVRSRSSLSPEWRQNS